MSRPSLEVADIFHHHGHLWRQSHHGHISLGQLKVMSAIERCRSAELGGHVLFCQACEHQQIAYNSCRNRHCPKCQASAAHRWLEARQADLLPVDYYHLVFTLPEPISDLAFQNKRVIYNLLFQAAAQTLQVIVNDMKHLGAKIGVTLVLHIWSPPSRARCGHWRWHIHRWRTMARLQAGLLSACSCLIASVPTAVSGKTLSGLSVEQASVLW